jgi:holo-[acyl-carrier protein] synthase
MADIVAEMRRQMWRRWLWSGVEQMAESVPEVRDNTSTALLLEKQLQEQMRKALAGAGPGAVVGIGVDLVEIDVFAALPFEENQHFYTRVYTMEEIAYCRSCAAPPQHFAARFAAKEAVVKACGGFARLTPAQIEIARTATGAPVVRVCSAPTLDKTYAVHVSLGHSATVAYAVALAVH